MCVIFADIDLNRTHISGIYILLILLSHLAVGGIDANDIGIERGDKFNYKIVDFYSGFGSDPMLISLREELFDDEDFSLDLDDTFELIINEIQTNKIVDVSLIKGETELNIDVNMSIFNSLIIHTDWDYWNGLTQSDYIEMGSYLEDHNETTESIDSVESNAVISDQETLFAVDVSHFVIFASEEGCLPENYCYPRGWESFEIVNSYSYDKTAGVMTRIHMERELKFTSDEDAEFSQITIEKYDKSSNDGFLPLISLLPVLVIFVCLSYVRTHKTKQSNF